MNRFGRLLARLRRRPGRDVDVTIPTLHLGSAYAGYVLSPAGLTPESVVYSGGVGEDVSFDLGLIERFGATIDAFDPTPRSIEWVRSHGLPPQFRFHDYGIAGYDGTARFTPPPNPAHVSHTLLPRRQSPRPSIDVPVRRLGTILESLGHDHVDLLKLDIEGAEYDVLDDLLNSRIAVGQILVEFHHRFEGVGVRCTEQALDRLAGEGYRLFYISQDGLEFSLLKG